LWSSLCCG